MKFIQRDFIPVIFGNDINVYSLARAFHEEYSIKSACVGKNTSGPCFRSKIIEYTAVPDIDDRQVFIETINSISNKYKDKKIILIGCGDNYITSIANYKEFYPANVVVPYLPYEKLIDITRKETFYSYLDKYDIKYPKTAIYDINSDRNTDFLYPVVIKPSDSVDYFANDFPGQKKVYVIETQQEFAQTLDKIYKSGYSSTLIIQEFIPGDDTNLRITVNYSDKNAKVRLISLGHGLLEEHTPKGIGNLSLIYLDYDEVLMKKLENFLNDIGFIGFSSFDMKYDSRDGEYKIFELNGRQPRSNYFTSGAGFNITKFLIDDYIFDERIDTVFAKADFLFTVLPKPVCFKYVKNPEALEKMRTLYNSKSYSNPMFYKGDNNIIRRLALIKTHFSHYKKYKIYMRNL